MDKPVLEGPLQISHTRVSTWTLKGLLNYYYKKKLNENKNYKGFLQA